MLLKNSFVGLLVCWFVGILCTTLEKVEWLYAIYNEYICTIRSPY